MKRRIYLDYASLTPIDRRVMRNMVKYSSVAYANPSALHAEGVSAARVVADSRKKIAEAIYAHDDEIVFTSGGTEANSLAILGVITAARTAGITNPHIIISAIEHASIIGVREILARLGCEVTVVNVDKFGIIDMDELKKSIKETTVIVSIMTVNNEIGSVQPIKEIVALIRKMRTTHSSVYPLFHTDAAQAFLTQDIFVEKMGVDLLTIDSSKIYGPRGIGCLFVKRGTPLMSQSYGGGQERGLRSGTENVPGIAGFAEAVSLSIKERVKEIKKLSILRQIFIDGLSEISRSITVNGAPTGAQSPHILNISIPDIDNELFLFRLDATGIACSTKSACLRDADESYVLKAMHIDSTHSLRFSFGRWTTKNDIRSALKAIRTILGTFPPVGVA